LWIFCWHPNCNSFLNQPKKRKKNPVSSFIISSIIIKLTCFVSSKLTSVSVWFETVTRWQVRHVLKGTKCNQTNLFCQQQINFRFRLIWNRNEVAGETLRPLDGDVDGGPGPVHVTLERFADRRCRVVSGTKQETF